MFFLLVSFVGTSFVASKSRFTSETVALIGLAKTNRKNIYNSATVLMRKYSMAFVVKTVIKISHTLYELKKRSSKVQL